MYIQIILTTFDNKQLSFMAKNNCEITDQNICCTSVTVKGIPSDIMKHILCVQWEMKIQKSAGTFSQSSAIISIIREHKQMKEAKK